MHESYKLNHAGKAPSLSDSWGIDIVKSHIEMRAPVDIAFSAAVKINFHISQSLPP